MKYFIASDIHGSYYYCEKMIEAFKNEKADRIILLGDILYHGPRNDLPKDYNPKKVIELLNEYKDYILCVRGNCEAEVDQMVLKFPCLAEYALLNINNNVVFITHGHKYNLDNIPCLKQGDIMLCGHTHVPTIETRDGITYLNPGSVSIPKNKSYNGYMTLEKNIFIFKDFEGNVRNTYEHTK